MYTRHALLLLGIVALSGCASNIAPDTYSVDSVGQVSQAQKATVISSRVVNVEGGRQRGGGSLAGGVVGGAAGSAIGGGSRVPIIGAVGGAVLGSILGRKAEDAASHQQALEYVVRTESGQTLTLVQGTEPAFADGAHVLLLNGSRARIIADPDTSTGH